MTVAVDVNAAAIPDELTKRDQWVCWEPVVRNGNETKIPKRPDGTGNAKSNDMATWGAFEEALSTADERENWGIGFMFSDADPYLGIDLDGCVRHNDRPKPKEWLPSLDMFSGTYSEFSPSGDGLHVILKDVNPPEWWTNQKQKVDGEENGIEVYDSAHYFTFTGDVHNAADVGTVDGLERWLLDGWEVFNDELPQSFKDTGDETGDSDDLADIGVYDVISRQSHPKGKRSEHPFHGSETGANFLVNDDGETFRCWRHGVTGNGLHLLGIETGVISCGEWDGTGLESDTWKEIFDQAREAGYEIPNPATTDGGTATVDTTANDTPAYPSLVERESEPVVPVPVSDSLDETLRTIRERLEDKENGYKGKLAMNDAARAIVAHEDYLYPDRVPNWIPQLHSYIDEEGIYESGGGHDLERLVDRAFGTVSAGFRKEIINKVTLRTTVRGGRTRRNVLNAPATEIVVGNGVLDLETGELAEYTPEKHHRTKLDWNYHEDAECPAIEEFIEDVVGEEWVDTVFRFIAHSLVQEYPDEKALMLYGDGQNGKTILLELIERFLHGEWYVSNETLTALNDDEWAAERLHGKLANVVADMGDASPEQMNTFKALTGGDRITANIKYEQDPVKFRNHATMMFAANDLPVLPDDTRGNWRRWVLVQCPYSFVEEPDPEEAYEKQAEPKAELTERLFAEEELEGLLARCQQEIERWADNNKATFFPNAPHWEETRRLMRKAAEPVFAFAWDCLEAEEGAEVPKSTLRAAYNEYATAHGLPKLSREKLGEELLNLTDYNIDTKRTRDGGGRVNSYTGIKLNKRGKELVGPGDGGPQGRADAVYRIAELNTTDEGMIRRGVLIGHCTSSKDFSQKQVTDAISKLLETGHLIDEGDERYRPV